MAGLQRSEISFRRQGSSGLVWDDKLISEELNSDKPASDQKPELRRSRSDGGGRRHTVKVEQAEDPPSPRLSSCGFCSYFGRPAAAAAATATATATAAKTNKRKSGKARHR